MTPCTETGWPRTTAPTTGSTGFGALATRHIPPARRAQLQRSLVRSHAAGSGTEVEREVVRALMLLRLSTLATGRTGVRVETAGAYAALLDAGVTPCVPEHGSLGCSGEARWAATAGGAAALQRTDVGHLGPGARADLILLDAPSHRHLAYRPGVPLVSTLELSDGDHHDPTPGFDPLLE